MRHTAALLWTMELKTKSQVKNKWCKWKDSLCLLRHIIFTVFIICWSVFLLTSSSSYLLFSLPAYVTVSAHTLWWSCSLLYLYSAEEWCVVLRDYYFRYLIGSTYILLAKLKCRQTLRDIDKNTQLHICERLTLKEGREWRKMYSSIKINKNYKKSG